MSILKKSIVASAALALPFAVSANSKLEKMMKDPNQWVQQSGDYAGHRYTELDQINKSNVGSLKVAWTFSTGVLRGHEGGPLVIGDTMYVHTAIPNIVYALDLNDNQRIIWKYNPVKGGKYPGGETMDRVISVMCCDNVNRGVNYHPNGTIVLHAADTSVIALDAKTGKEKWITTNLHAGTGKYGVSASTGSGQPFIIKDMVGVGCSGAEFGVRCNWTQYDINSGKRLWRAYSMGPDKDMLVDPNKTTSMLKPIGKDSSLKTWPGDAWKIGGGSIWGFYGYDSKLNTLYYGTGNPSTWNPVVRPGDNKWSMTINARNPDNGMAKWLYQMTPYDEWDYDGVNEMILVDMKVKGKNRQALVHFDRNGFAYTWAADNGDLIAAEKVHPFVNWASDVDLKSGVPNKLAEHSTHQDYNTKGTCPAALGTKDQQPAADSPKTGLVYSPMNHVCMTYEPVESKYVAGQPWVGATLTMFAGPDGVMGGFAAYDPMTNKKVWYNKEKFSAWGGALTTASDLVFYGTLDRWFKALDAKSGKELWKFQVGSGVIGNAFTYGHKGKQYVGVLSGIGGWAGVAMNLGLTNDTDALGAAGGYKELTKYNAAPGGGALTVFSL